MEAMDFTIRKRPCSSPLPELEVPMINRWWRVWEWNTDG
jgi:hypothetical protein